MEVLFMKKKKNKIKCDVTNCIYNDINQNDCSLDKVKITSMGRGDNCLTSSSTLCQSFEKSSGIITDNEYEIDCEMNSDENTHKLEKEANSKD